MSDLHIKKNELEQAIRYSKDIEKYLTFALDDAKKLLGFISQMQWKGETKNAFYTYIELIIKYHEKLNEIMKNNAKALEGLKGKIEKFEQSPIVNHLKEV